MISKLAQILRQRSYVSAVGMTNVPLIRINGQSADDEFLLNR